MKMEHISILDPRVRSEVETKASGREAEELTSRAPVAKVDL